jgi:hypothetical protein
VSEDNKMNICLVFVSYVIIKELIWEIIKKYFYYYEKTESISNLIITKIYNLIEIKDKIIISPSEKNKITELIKMYDLIKNKQEINEYKILLEEYQKYISIEIKDLQLPKKSIFGNISKSVGQIFNTLKADNISNFIDDVDIEKYIINSIFLNKITEPLNAKITEYQIVNIDYREVYKITTNNIEIINIFTEINKKINDKIKINEKELVNNTLNYLYQDSKNTIYKNYNRSYTQLSNYLNFNLTSVDKEYIINVPKKIINIVNDIFCIFVIPLNSKYHLYKDICLLLENKLIDINKNTNNTLINYIYKLDFKNIYTTIIEYFLKLNIEFENLIVKQESAKRKAEEESAKRRAKIESYKQKVKQETPTIVSTTSFKNDGSLASPHVI